MGSGEKYKRCHLRADGRGEAARASKGAFWWAIGVLSASLIAGLVFGVQMNRLGLAVLSVALGAILASLVWVARRVSPRGGRLVGKAHAEIDPRMRHLDED